MAEDYHEVLMGAVGEATILVHHLEDQGDADSLSRAALDRARSLAERVEEVLSGAMGEYSDPAANAAARQALEAVDGFRAAAAGGDLGMMRSAAHGILDHVTRARDSVAPPQRALAGARGGEAIAGPRRRWKFGPGGAEEAAPPPASPEDEPSFNSAAIERSAEAHFTPGPEEK